LYEENAKEFSIRIQNPEFSDIGKMPDLQISILAAMSRVE